MSLRDHPLMKFKGVPSWPPDWIWTGGAKNQRPRGEVGILQEVLLSILIQLTDAFYIFHTKDHRI
jgi:hypothetical protein